VAEAESRRAADAAERAYREAFNRGVPPDEGQLEAEHSRALAVAHAVFNEAAVGARHMEFLIPTLGHLLPGLQAFEAFTAALKPRRAHPPHVISRRPQN
jgi:hypothetical protein